MSSLSAGSAAIDSAGALLAPGSVRAMQSAAENASVNRSLEIAGVFCSEHHEENVHGTAGNVAPLFLLLMILFAVLLLDVFDCCGLDYLCSCLRPFGTTEPAVRRDTSAEPTSALTEPLTTKVVVDSTGQPISTGNGASSEETSSEPLHAKADADAAQAVVAGKPLSSSTKDSLEAGMSKERAGEGSSAPKEDDDDSPKTIDMHGWFVVAFTVIPVDTPPARAACSRRPLAPHAAPTARAARCAHPSLRSGTLRLSLGPPLSLLPTRERRPPPCRRMPCDACVRDGRVLPCLCSASSRSWAISTSRCSRPSSLARPRRAASPTA
jgi:hypothetical protein